MKATPSIHQPPVITGAQTQKRSTAAIPDNKWRIYAESPIYSNMRKLKVRGFAGNRKTLVNCSDIGKIDKWSLTGNNYSTVFKSFPLVRLQKAKIEDFISNIAFFFTFEGFERFKVNDIRPHEVGKLLHSFKYTKQLRNLDCTLGLHASRVLEKGIKPELLSILKHNRKLEKVGFSKIRITEWTIKALSKIKTLASLTIKECEIDENAMTALAKYIKGSNLTTFHLYEGFFVSEPPSYLQLIEALANKELKACIFSARSCQLEELTELFQTLNPETIEVLDLSTCKIVGQSVGALCDFIIRAANLKSLKLNNSLRGGIDQVATALAINNNLQALDICGNNKLNEKEIETLSNFLSSNETLTILALEDINIAKEYELLFYALQNSKIQSLKLGSNYEISPEVATALDFFLRNTETLVTLDLSKWVGIQEPELESIIASIEDNMKLRRGPNKTTLNEIHLYSCLNSMPNIIKLVEKHPNIICCNLERNSWVNEENAELDSLLKRNRLFRRGVAYKINS